MCQRSYLALLQLLLFVVGPAIVDWQDTDSLIKLQGKITKPLVLQGLAKGSYCYGLLFSAFF